MGFAYGNVSVWLKPPGLRIENDAAPVPLFQYSCAIGAIVHEYIIAYWRSRMQSIFAFGGTGTAEASNLNAGGKCEGAVNSRSC